MTVDYIFDGIIFATVTSCSFDDFNLSLWFFKSSVSRIRTWVSARFSISWIHILILDILFNVHQSKNFRKNFTFRYSRNWWKLWKVLKKLLTDANCNNNEQMQIDSWIETRIFRKQLSHLWSYLLWFAPWMCRIDEFTISNRFVISLPTRGLQPTCRTLLLHLTDNSGKELTIKRQ